MLSGTDVHVWSDYEYVKLYLITICSVNQSQILGQDNDRRRRLVKSCNDSQDHRTGKMSQSDKAS